MSVHSGSNTSLHPGGDVDVWSQDRHDYDALTAIASHLREYPAHPFSGRQCEEFVQAARDAQFAPPAVSGQLLIDAYAAMATLCARYGYADDHTTPLDWSEWQEARRVKDALAAVLARSSAPAATPTAGDEAAEGGGMHQTKEALK